MDRFDPPIVFLGFCERAAYVRDGGTGLFKWNILGLKHIILSNFFPLKLDGWTIGVAVRTASLGKPVRVSITDEVGVAVGHLDFALEVSVPTLEEISLRSDNIHLMIPKIGWTTVFWRLRDSGILIRGPGLYYVKLLDDGEPIVIGEVRFAVIDPPTLTPERIAAI
jgi:hypothetical protein